MSIIQFLFGFHGRIRRLHLWLFVLASWLCGFGLLWQFGHIGNFPYHHDMMMDSRMSLWTGPAGSVYFVTHNPFVGLVGLLFFWMHLAVFVKRWHDRDKSGWWVLLIVIPVVNLIGGIWTLIECGFLEGTIGGNTYGPDPKGRA